MFVNAAPQERRFLKDHSLCGERLFSWVETGFKLISKESLLDDMFDLRSQGE